MSASRVTVLAHKRIASFPKYPNPQRIDLADIGDALTKRYSTDAHLAVYEAPTLPYRLSVDLFRKPEHGGLIPAEGISLGYFFGDVDCAVAHRSQGGNGNVPASDEWWIAERAKIDCLLAAHPGLFVYVTRGGYRFVGALESPHIVRNTADEARWVSFYVESCAYLTRAFGIAADISCSDVTRLFRLPLVRRDGRAEERETIGNPHRIGLWKPAITAEDIERAKRLKPKKAAKVRQKLDAERDAAPSGASGRGILFHALCARGDVGREISSGVHAVRCTNEAAHTGGTSFDSSTILYEPGPGEIWGWPHCAHAHCVGRGVRETIASFTEEDLAKARELAGVDAEEAVAEATLLNDGTRPEIVISTEEAEVDSAAIEALARVPSLYSRGGELVDVVGATIRAPIPLPRLREMMTEAARWVTPHKDRETGDIVMVPCHPPEWAVKQVFARGTWPGLRELVSIAITPMLRADGTILQGDARYDESSGVLYMPSIKYPEIPEFPSLDDAIWARNQLLEVAHDFPFANEDHRAAWLASLFTLFARDAIDCAPLMAYDAACPGSGKGLLVRATHIIAYGTEPEITTHCEDDAAMRKKISAFVIEGVRFAFLDNVRQPLGTESLEAALTTPGVWRDRLLGFTATLGKPYRLTWFASGNNLEPASRDMIRRILHIRLVSPLENPEDRAEKDFAHPDLAGWVRAERPRLVRAALTILRAHAVAKRPRGGVALWGSFEQWSKIVAAAVVWVGMTDPQRTRLALKETGDTKRENQAALLRGWMKLAPAGHTVRAVFLALFPDGPRPDDAHDDLREAIRALAPPKNEGGRPDDRALGRVLSTLRDRVIAGMQLETDGTGLGGGLKYVVRALGPVPDSDSIDSSDSAEAHPV